ncbi:MAG: glutaredoxin family protein [Candidatus Thermoplasmatota archaeon]|nr:glutaredoxin family protein [Candidatus Thermoplasmatota archaeon]MBS3790272.1 glutaredoxin family protein [Candidatus Thermoplasmatota archaeon]
MSAKELVSGEKDERDVKVFTISTCGWCKKVKNLLKSLDVEYEYIDIDQVEGEEKKRIREELKEYNSKMSCPTLVIDEGEEIIIGFKEDKIKEALK